MTLARTNVEKTIGKSTRIGKAKKSGEAEAAVSYVCEEWRRGNQNQRKRVLDLDFWDL